VKAGEQRPDSSASQFAGVAMDATTEPMTITPEDNKMDATEKLVDPTMNNSTPKKEIEI